MMTDTISFKDLIQLIHPDRNPGLEDAGEKVKYCKMYRKEPNILYKLGVQWGVIGKPEPLPKPRIVPAPRTVTPRKPERRVVETKPTPEKTERSKAWNTSVTQEEIDARVKQVKQDLDDHFKFRVRNRIFLAGDRIYIRTKKLTLTVTKVTEKRVYFIWNGKETFARKENVRHTRVQ